MVLTRACFKKNSSLHIWPKNFRTTFLGILPQILQFLSVENSDEFFLVIAPFLRFSVHPYFHILHMMNPNPIFADYTPLIYAPTCSFHVSTPCFVLS